MTTESDPLVAIKAKPATAAAIGVATTLTAVLAAAGLFARLPVEDPEALALAVENLLVALVLIKAVTQSAKASSTSVVSFLRGRK